MTNVSQEIEKPRHSLPEIVELFTQGQLSRVYVVAQELDGRISEYEFSYEQEGV